MILLINVRYVVAVGSLMLMFAAEGHTNHIPIYRDMCNETISLGNAISAGRLVFQHYSNLNRQRCNIVIETDPGHRIGYSFRETSAFRTIFIKNDHIFYTCSSVVWQENGSKQKYGCVNSNYTNELKTTFSNTLTLDVRGDELTDFTFELVVFSFHYGNCRSFEVSCKLLLNSNRETFSSVCIDSMLAYDKTFDFCDSHDYEDTGDIVKDNINFNGSLIAAIVLLCIIFIPLLTLTGCLMFRKFCKSPEPEPEDIPTRARRIFSAILAEASDNAGYDSGPIDPSKFDPPPDYGSLEQLDGAGTSGSSVCSDKRLSQISIDCPPSYGDVMRNSNEYLVSSHI